MSNGSFIDDLSDIEGLNQIGKSTNSHSTPKAARETFPCESCRGTGRYQGVRVHQEASECFACKGKGYFFKSFADRQAGKAKRFANKTAKVEKAKNNFEATNPGMLEAMRSLAGWNNFVADLLGRVEAGNDLTEKQVAAIQNQIDKARARDAARAAERIAKEANTPKVDPSAIKELFDVAHSNGLKKVGLWFGDLKISEAPAHGANAGALYVKVGGEYAGKIVGNNFKAAWGVKADPILADLLAIAANPAEVLRVKGKETGKCCCCGRELTDPESIAAGIGPICASNWGL